MANRRELCDYVAPLLIANGFVPPKDEPYVTPDWDYWNGAIFGAVDYLLGEDPDEVKGISDWEDGYHDGYRTARNGNFGLVD